MLNPNELLYQEAGIPTGSPTISPQTMLAMLMLKGKQPQRMAGGGMAKYAFPALMGLAAVPETLDAAKDKKYLQHGVNAADLIASGLSLPYWLYSSMLGSGNLSAGTLDEQERPSALTGPLSQYLLSLGANK